MCAHTLFTGLLIATTIAIKEYLFRIFLAIAALCSSVVATKQQYVILFIENNGAWYK